MEGKDNNIIPIGLVDLAKLCEYCISELDIWNSKCIELNLNYYIRVI